jgi:hypothetical protein
MPTIEVPNDTYHRVEEFAAVVRAVLDEETDAPACLGMALDRGLQAMLADIIARQEQPVLVESFQQLAARDPELVYGYVADMVGLGADIRKRKAQRRRIGF